MAPVAIAAYRRHCGYRVIEAALVDGAKTLLMHPEITIDVVLSAVILADQWMDSARSMGAFRAPWD